MAEIYPRIYFNIHKMRNIYKKIVEHNQNAINTVFTYYRK